MKWTLTINQKIIVEQKHDIDIIDAAILETMKNMQGSGGNGIRKIVHNHIDYYWMAHQKLCDELPILRIKKDTMYRRIKKLIEKKYIVPHPENKAMRATYYRVTKLTDSLFSGNIGNKSDISENNPIATDENPKPIGKQSENISDESPKDNITIDTNTKNPTTSDTNNNASAMLDKQKQEIELLKNQLKKEQADKKELRERITEQTNNQKPQETIFGEILC